MSQTSNGVSRFFYLERGYGVFVPRPRRHLRLLRRDRTRNVYTEDAHTDTRAVRAALPERAAAIASLRHRIYLEDPNRERYGVLTLFDEWNAYVASARVAVELFHTGRYYRESRPDYDPWNGKVRRIGELEGMVDFLYFASAGIAAIADREPEYLRDNEQLRALYALLAEDTVRWLERGSKLPLFAGFHAAELLRHFAHSPDNEPIRRTLHQWLGSAWTSRVLGF